MEEPLSPRVRQLIAIRTTLDDDRHQFALKHGFAYTRAQNFKNCIVIRWKATKIKYAINHARIEEYVKVSHDLSDKYGLWMEEYPLLDAELRLFKAGIYVFYEWGHHTWAIPNEYKEIQDYVLSKLPKWAKVSVKK